MNPGVVAGLSFADRTMRYAEVLHERHGNTLRRLGSCRFDFSVAQSLTRTDSSDYMTLAEAVGEIFAGTGADLLSIALDPRLCYHFSTSIPFDADESTLTRQVLKELALVADDETPLFVSTESLDRRDLPGGDAVSWVQVFALPETTRSRLRGLADVLGVPIAITSSLDAAASFVGYLEEDTLGVRDTSYSLLLGDHTDYAEFAVCSQGRRRVAGLSMAEDPADGVHALWSFVRRLGLSPADLQTVYLYGDNQETAFADIPKHSGATLRRLGPLDVVRLNAGASATDLASYVPCVGAALAQSA
jgi:hypothetical protein